MENKQGFQIDFNELNSKIDRSRFSSDEENDKKTRQILRDMTTAIQEYIERSISDIKAYILESEKNNILNDDSIITALLPEDRKEYENVTHNYKNYLEPMLKDDYSGKYIFLNEDYEKLRDIIGDESEKERYFKGTYKTESGESKEFKYKLKFCKDYVLRHGLVEEIGKYYLIPNKIVYSPYSYKFFELIWHEDCSQDKVHDVDYKFKANGLNVIERKKIYWNIKVTEIPVRVGEKKTPYGTDIIKYKYTFPKSKNENNVYVIPKNNQVIVYDIKITADEIIMWIDHNSCQFLKMELVTFENTNSVYQDLKDKNFIFDNKVSKNFFELKRINSNMDIEFAIRPFRSLNNVRCSIVNPENMDFFWKYSSKYCSFISDFTNKLCKAYIKFETDGETIFLNDYVNYVLLFLSKKYPEIEWNGVK